MAPPTSSNNFIEEIYDMVNGKITTSAEQIFQMEFPCRLLDQGTYDYSGSDTINAQQFKPQVVAEAEFRLSDDMYDISNLMGGPNSKQVSATYAEVLGQLIPTGDSGDAQLGALRLDQDGIEAWLLQLVLNYDPPDEDILANVPAAFTQYLPGAATKDTTIPSASAQAKIPRVDLYQKLVDNYEAQRLRWTAFKTNARPDQTSSAATVDEYNRMLASFAMAVDKKLEALWTVLLVRGQYHRVRRMIGFLDIESSSEVLQVARENLRASVLRSIDDTEDVYPVYFSPANWASFLSTAFSPEDLLSSPDQIRGALVDKEALKNTFIQRLNDAKGAQPDISGLEAAEEQARGAFYTARDATLAGYADNAVTAIKLYFSVLSRQATSPAALITKLDALKTAGGAATDLNAALTKVSADPISDAQWSTLLTGWNETTQRQTAMQEASEGLLKAQMAASAARGNDQTSLIQTLEAEIMSLQQDIDYMTAQLQTSTNATGVPISAVQPATDQTAPASVSLPPQMLGASSWSEIVQTRTYSTSTSSSFHSTVSSSSSWSTSFFFGGGSGSSSSSSSTSTLDVAQASTEIEIGMRIMKVEMERPWMDGSLFDQTAEFYHGNLTKISSAEPTDVKAATSAADGAAMLETANSCLLPSWPTAFVVVKDVHIIFHDTRDTTKKMVSDLQSTANSGGGFFCFSCSSSSGSSENRQSASVTASSNSISVMIPAPQIIGWISELCPKDKCQPNYTPVNKSEYALTPTASS